MKFTPICFDNWLNPSAEATDVAKAIGSISENFLPVLEANLLSLIAKEQHQIAKSNLLPIPTLGTTLTQGFNRPFLPGDSRVLGFGMGFQQSLVNLPLWAQIRTAKINSQSRDLQTESVYQEGYRVLSGSYMEILNARYRVSLAVENYWYWVQFKDGLFDYANRTAEEKRFADSYESQTFNTKHDVMELLGRAFIAFKEQTGIDLNSQNLKEPLPLFIPATLKLVISQAMKENPFYLYTKAAVQSAEESVKRVRGGFAPRISIGADYGGITSVGGRGRGQAYDLSSSNYNVTATANIDLNIKARISELKIAIFRTLSRAA